MKIISIGLPILFLMAFQASASPGALTLSGALKLGTEKSPTLQAAIQTREAARLESLNAGNAFLPSLDISTTQQAGGPAGTSSWSLSATESIWNHGSTWINLKTARLDEETAEYALAEAREKLASQIASQWFDYSRLEALLGIQAEKASLIEKQFAVMKEQFEQGLKTREDFQRIRAQLLATRAELISLRAQRDQIQVALLATLGISPTEAETLSIHPARPPQSPTPRWLELFEKKECDLTQNPTLSRIRTGKLRTELAPEQARYNYWPNLDFSAAIVQGGTGPLARPLQAGSNGPSELEWNAGITLSWNLWDWGILARKVQVADLTRGRQQAELRREELGLMTDARQATLELARLKEESQLQSEVARMEEDNFRVVEDNYRRGRTSYLDLITALRDRSDARARWNAAYFSTLKTHVQLLQLEGKAHAWLLAFDEKFQNP